MLSAEIGELLEEPLRRHDQPAVRLDRLDEGAADLFGWRRRCELLFQEVEDRVAAGVALIGPEGVGVGQQDQAVGLGRARLDAMAGECHGTGGAAVIGADEGDDAGAAGRLGDRPEDGLVGIGAGMAEPHLVSPVAGKKAEQFFGKGGRRRIGGRQDAGARRIGDGARHRLDEGRVAIAEACGTPGAGEVDQFAAALLHEARAMAAGDGERKEAQLLQAGNGLSVPFVEAFAQRRHSSRLVFRQRVSRSPQAATPTSVSIRSCLTSINTPGSLRASAWTGTV